MPAAIDPPEQVVGPGAASAVDPTTPSTSRTHKPSRSRSFVILIPPLRFGERTIQSTQGLRQLRSEGEDRRRFARPALSGSLAGVAKHGGCSSRDDKRARFRPPGGGVVT